MEAIQGVLLLCGTKREHNHCYGGTKGKLLLYGAQRVSSLISGPR